MPRSREGPRVIGVYEEPGADSWRVVFVGSDGKRRSKFFPAEHLARGFARRLGAKIGGSPTVAKAIVGYREHLEVKRNRPRSIATTIARIERWLGDEGQMIGEVTSSQLTAVYDARRGQVAVDTYRNEFAEVRTFLRWCVMQRWIKEDPTQGVTLEGKRRAGKKRKLHVQEARRFQAAAVEAYRRRSRGWESGLGCLLALRCGLRASEICGLRVRDIDPVRLGEVWVWVASEGEGKSSAATRQVEAVGELAELLLAQAKHARSKKSDWLFPALTKLGHRERTWIRKACYQLCDRAGLPRVSPHGLRGSWATIARGVGATARSVADALGHEHERTTERHYIEHGTVERAAGRAVFEVLEGGLGGPQNPERNDAESFRKASSGGLRSEKP